MLMKIRIDQITEFRFARHTYSGGLGERVYTLMYLSEAHSRLYGSRLFGSKYSVVIRCCAKEERQRGSDEGGKAEKKARRAGEEEESGKRRGGGGEYLSIRKRTYEKVNIFRNEKC